MLNIVRKDKINPKNIYKYLSITEAENYLDL